MIPGLLAVTLLAWASVALHSLPQFASISALMIAIVLGLLVRNRFYDGETSHRSQAVSWLELPRHNPPPSRLPKAVNPSGDDGFLIQLDSECRIRRVMVDGDERSVFQFTRRRFLGQDRVAHSQFLDPLQTMLTATK